MVENGLTTASVDINCEADKKSFQCFKVIFYTLPFFLLKFWKTKNQTLSQNSSVQVSQNDVILQNQIKLENDVSLAGFIAFFCYMKYKFIYIMYRFI